MTICFATQTRDPDHVWLSSFQKVLLDCFQLGQLLFAANENNFFLFKVF